MSGYKIVVDCSTGESTQIPLSAIEIAELEANTAREERERLDAEAAAENSAADKESGYHNLKVVGLTVVVFVGITS